MGNLHILLQNTINKHIFKIKIWKPSNARWYKNRKKYLTKIGMVFFLSDSWISFRVIVKLKPWPILNPCVFEWTKLKIFSFRKSQMSIILKNGAPSSNLIVGTDQHKKIRESYYEKTDFNSQIHALKRNNNLQKSNFKYLFLAPKF